MSDSSDTDDCLVLPDPNPDPSNFTIAPCVAKEEMKDESKDRKESLSDTETISTIDLCPKKKASVSLNTYVNRQDASVLKKQLERLNSTPSESVSTKLSRDSKRRKIEVDIIYIKINAQ